MIHFKPGFKKVKVFNGVSTSRLDTLLDVELIEKLPIILYESISEVYKVTEMTMPTWLLDKPGWKVSKDT